MDNRFLRVGALRERMKLERLLVIKKMEELRLDSILVDVGSWWKSMEDDNFEIMQDGEENTKASSSREECKPGVIPQEGCSNWGEGDTVAQTEEECDKASSHREGDLTADDVSTQQDHNTPADPFVGTEIDNKPKLTNLEKRRGVEGRKRLYFLQRYFPNTRMSPGGTETLTVDSVPMDGRKNELDAAGNTCSSPGQTANRRSIITSSRKLNPIISTQLSKENKGMIRKQKVKVTLGDEP